MLIPIDWPSLEALLASCPSTLRRCRQACGACLGTSRKVAQLLGSRMQQVNVPLGQSSEASCVFLQGIYVEIEAGSDVVVSFQRPR